MPRLGHVLRLIWTKNHRIPPAIFILARFAGKSLGNPNEPGARPDCGTVFHKDRSMAPDPPEPHQALCPACHRVHDRYPGGYLTLGGDFLKSHREESLRLIRHAEVREKTDHPLCLPG
jgi:hypothetical protein